LRADGAESRPDSPDLSIGHEVSTRTRTEQDRQSFAESVRSLRTGGMSLNLSERTLMVLGGVLAPLGLVLVLLGWVGASRTPNLFEQVPYLISGGLFGLALVFLGSFFYFAHWITELVKESRTQSAALLTAIEDLRDDVRSGAARDVPVRDTPATSAADNGSVPLVATVRGSMAHRPDCVVVAGKDDLRAVTASDALMACKLCDPSADT
jgi:multisubunit Na+/H+ antiporter MnhG subunit